MRALATWCLRHRRLVLAGWIAALVAIAGIAGTVGASYSSNFNLPSSDSQRANDLLKHSFPAQAGDQAQVVFHVTSGSVTDPAVRARMQPALAQIAGTPHVVGVQSPYVAAGAHAVSRDGRTAYAVVRFDQRANALPKADALRVIDIAHGAARSGLQVEAGGQPIERAQNQSGSTQSGIGLLAAIIVLLFTFGSVVAMGMPVITALFALGVGLSLVTLATKVFDVADFSPQLAAMIGLGVGIDYALFVVTRFRSGLREGLEVREAVITAIDTAGRAVFFAGTTVIVALLGMLLLGVTFLRGPAIASALAVLFTMIASLTLLPALLGMLGRRIDRWRFPLGKGASGGGESWARWARFVQRRPWPLALGATALLLTLCIPTLSLRLGSSDAGSDPASTTTRKAYDLLAQGFGPGFNGPLQVVAALPRSGDGATAIRLRNAMAAERGVATVTPAQLSPSGDVAVLTALSNDVGFEAVFARQIAAFGRAGDLAVGLSTSGNSANLLRAFDEAHRRNLLTVGIAGYDGGLMAGLHSIDHLFVVASPSVHRIQEAQTTIYHALWELTLAALAQRAPGRQESTGSGGERR